MKRIIPAITIILYLITAVILKTWVSETLADIYLFWGMIGAMTEGTKKLNSKFDWIIGFPCMMWILVCITLYLLSKNPQTGWRRVKIILQNEKD